MNYLILLERVGKCGLIVVLSDFLLRSEHSAVSFVLVVELPYHLLLDQGLLALVRLRLVPHLNYTDK